MNTPNVMVVGSDRDWGEEISEDLASLGYNCCGVASDLKTVMRIAKTYSVDVAIIDFSSGDETELATIAATIRKSTDILVIYITQALEPSIVDELSRGPAVGFVLTPCTPAKLRSAMENLLELELERTVPWTTKLGKLNLVPSERMSGVSSSRRFGYL